MADITVEVEEESDGENAPEEVTPGTAHAEETLIDAGIASGVAAVRADDAAGDAATSEVAAEIHAGRAEAAAEVAHAELSDMAAIAADLRATAQMLAATASAQAAGQVQENVLAEPDIDPMIDVEPVNTHFLNRKWSLFGKKDRD